MTDHSPLRELTGAYALGTLSDRERREVEAHLATCAECAAEVRGFLAVADGLGRAVEQYDPPPELRARVLAVARAEGTASRSAGVVIPGWLLLAASVALVAVSAYAMTLRGRVTALEAEIRAARDRAAVMDTQIAGLRQAVSEGTRVADILGAADVARVDLAGQLPARGASGRAFWSRSRGAMLFTAANLPPLPPGRVYQLWLLKGQSAVSAGLVPIVESGRATAVTSTPDMQADAIAVSIEPAGGVPAPTGAVYLVGTLQQ